jgi:tetratricopeptide (TPR) repeat protein
MRAYDAYNAGNNAQARQDYKQVLKRYGPNVDAMLGLGAIAARQSRIADANGWYRRVLEVEPRNEMAKAGMISLQQKTQPQNSESSIKFMLATAPDDANLHAALGDVYASQGQWSAAQQAYFDAYRFNPSTENAFNLGVSLDQLGKSKLALPYYQEALQQADQSSVIDAVALKARISSIE